MFRSAVYICISQSEVGWILVHVTCLAMTDIVFLWAAIPHCQLQAHDEIFGGRNGTSILKMVSASFAVARMFRTAGCTSGQA